MKNTKKILFIATVVLLLIAFGVSAFMVVNYLAEGKKQEDRNNQLAQMVSQASTEPKETKPAPPQRKARNRRS